MGKGSWKVCVDGGRKMKEEEAARCPELGAEVPNVNSTEGGRGAMFVPFARKEAQWYGALADGGASRNSVHDKPHRWGWRREIIGRDDCNADVRSVGVP